MIRYELKKVFARTGSKIALLLLAIVWCIVSKFAMDVCWVNEDGVSERGYAAVSRLRASQREWAGALDEERLRRLSKRTGVSIRHHRRNLLTIGA